MNWRWTLSRALRCRGVGGGCSKGADGRDASEGGGDCIRADSGCCMGRGVCRSIGGYGRGGVLGRDGSGVG